MTCSVLVFWSAPALAGGTVAAEADALREWQVPAPVDRIGLPPHVRLPCVRSGLASAAGLLLAAEGAADLGARGADVDVGDPAIAAGGGQESFCMLQPLRKERRR